MKKITIVGGGVMGNIFAQALQSDYEVTICGREDNKSICQAAEYIILAVKPQAFVEVAKQLQGHLQEPTIISIMAGVSLDTIKNSLGLTKVVRTMPNLGAQVNKSMTVWTSAGVEEKKEITKILSKLGKTLEVANEDIIDKATAVSGSGPGFFFYIVAEWLKAIIDLGFSATEAKLLLFTTLDGANDLLQQTKLPSELVEQVTSKGGTTEAGLKILKENQLKAIWDKVLQAAEKRAKELAD